MAPDDLADVVIGHGQLVHDRAVVFLEALDLHRARVVDQATREEREQVIHGRQLA